MKIRAYQILVSLVLIISLLIIGLRGTSSQPVAYQTDTLQDATAIQGFGLGPQLWSDTFSSNENWPLTVPSTASASLQLNSSLTLNIGFTSQPNAQAVSVVHGINLSFDGNPIVTIQVTVSAAVHYGVRFSGMTPTGTTFDAWRENSALQHRPGQGTPENISVNPQLEAYLANNQTPPPGSKITQISFYVEATPGTQGQYTMKITTLDAFAQEQTTSATHRISGSFLAVAIHLDLPPTTLSLFQTFVSFDIRGTSNLQYTPFLVNGTTVLAQGFTYVQIAATAHQDAVLLPQFPLSFPSMLPTPNSTEIIIGAKVGQINYFQLDGLVFKYTSTPLQTQGLVDPNIANLMIGYYLLFLFVTPIAAVILLTKVFKPEN